MAIKFDKVKYNDLSLDIEINENQIVSIVGANGAGKTSILNLLFGLESNFTGKIIIDDKCIENNIKKRELKEYRKQIFYLNEDYKKQFFNINILEDIKYFSSKLDYTILQDLLKSFNLNEDILSKTYFELSDGQLKKILIIAMLVSNRKIILLDNPTSSLDQKGISTLVKLLKKQKRNNKTIIVVSEDSEFLLSITDKIISIDKEKLNFEENKYEFFSSKEKLDKCKLDMPKVLKFRQIVLNKKGIKLMYRDNINDLLKDIYRNVK